MKSKDLINEMQQTITELQTELNAEKQNSVDLQKKLNEIAPKWSRLVALRSALTERNAANEALLEELPKGSPCYKTILEQINLDYIILEYLAIPFGDY